MIGSMNDEILNVEELAIDTIKIYIVNILIMLLNATVLIKKRLPQVMMKMLSIQIIQ